MEKSGGKKREGGKIDTQKKWRREETADRKEKVMKEACLVLDPATEQMATPQREDRSGGARVKISPGTRTHAPWQRARSFCLPSAFVRDPDTTGPTSSPISWWFTDVRSGHGFNPFWKSRLFSTTMNNAYSVVFEKMGLHNNRIIFSTETRSPRWSRYSNRIKPLARGRNTRL